jgi:hypothetical protein
MASFNDYDICIIDFFSAKTTKAILFDLDHEKYATISKLAIIYNNIICHIASGIV